MNVLVTILLRCCSCCFFGRGGDALRLRKCKRCQELEKIYHNNMAIHERAEVRVHDLVARRRHLARRQLCSSLALHRAISEAAESARQSFARYATFCGAQNVRMTCATFKPAGERFHALVKSHSHTQIHQEPVIMQHMLRPDRVEGSRSIVTFCIVRYGACLVRRRHE